MMKYATTSILILAVLAGCNKPDSPTIQQQAHQRWYRTRANVLHGLASEHYQSGQLDKARAKILEALAMDADFAPGRTLLGKIYIEQGHYALAVGELTKAQEMMPRSADALYYLGVAQEKAGQTDAALVSYRRSQELDGTNMAPVIAAAEVLAGQGKVRQAQLYIESYVDNAGGEPGVFELAGRLAMMQQEFAKAADYFQQAQDLDFDNLGYIESLARAQYFAGRYDLALANLTHLAAQEGYPLTSSLHAMLGDCYTARGRIREARDAYMQAVELDPSNAGAWLNLARSTLTVGDPARAIIAARQALTLDGGSLDATLLLGYALLRDGQVSGSLHLLRPAVDRYPASAELLCVLGRAHDAAGDQSEAQRCYDAAMQVDPSSVLARELRDNRAAG